MALNDPNTFPLEYARGDSFASQFQIVQSDEVTPEDITGWSFSLTVDSRKDPDDDSTQCFSIAGSIDDLAEALVSFAPSEAQTDLTPGKYWYDLEAVDGAGRKRTLIKDYFRIKQDLTKVPAA